MVSLCYYLCEVVPSCPVTCDLSGGGALALLAAGRQFGGGGVKVAQLAGETGGAAKAAASRPGHIVDGVHGGKDGRVPGNHHRLATTGVSDVLRRTRGCRGEDTEGHRTRSRVSFVIVGSTNRNAKHSVVLIPKATAA